MNAYDFANLDAEEKMRRTVIWFEGDSHEFWADVHVRKNVSDEDLKKLGLTWLKKGPSKWYQVGVGTFQEVGKDHGRPVCISIFWYFIDGVPVGIWEPTSQVVNYPMIEDFLKKYGAFRSISYADFGRNTFDRTSPMAVHLAQNISKELLKRLERDGSEDPYLIVLERGDPHLRYLVHFDWFNPHGDKARIGVFPERC